MVDTGKAVIADVTATLTAQTPSGPFTTIDNGRFWRSNKDQFRFDSGNGLSARRDSRGPVKSLFLDEELRIADALVDRTFWLPPRQTAQEPYGTRYWQQFAPPGKQNEPGSNKPKITKSVLEGQKVTIQSGEYGGLSYELWISESLHLVLLVKYRTATSEFEQRFHNIRQEEPDKSVFELPGGYKMRVICAREPNEAGGTHPPFHDSPNECK